MPIAAGPAILGAAAIGGVAAIATGIMGSNASQSAAQTQAAAAGDSLALQNAQYQQNRTDTLPWLVAGQTALAQYGGELGLTKTNADGTPFTSQFQETPGYQYDVSQAEKGVDNNLAALGLRGSGAALKALTKTRMGLADSTYNNYLNRLQSAAGMGQTQANTNATAGTTNAINSGNLLQSAADARASGYINSANAFSNSLGNLSQTGSNALGWLSATNSWGAPVGSVASMGSKLAGGIG